MNGTGLKHTRPLMSTAWTATYADTVRRTIVRAFLDADGNPWYGFSDGGVAPATHTHTTPETACRHMQRLAKRFSADSLCGRPAWMSHWAWGRLLKSRDERTTAAREAEARDAG